MVRQGQRRGASFEVEWGGAEMRRCSGYEAFARRRSRDAASSPHVRAYAGQDLDLGSAEAVLRVVLHVEVLRVVLLLSGGGESVSGGGRWDHGHR